MARLRAATISAPSELVQQPSRHRRLSAQDVAPLWRFERRAPALAGDGREEGGRLHVARVARLVMHPPQRLFERAPLARLAGGPVALARVLELDEADAVRTQSASKPLEDERIVAFGVDLDCEHGLEALSQQKVVEGDRLDASQFCCAAPLHETVQLVWQRDGCRLRARGSRRRFHDYLRDVAGR
eukprot:3448607-Prymnesium_polylepis.1